MTRRRSKEEIKKQLMDSIVNNDIIGKRELNEKADKVEKPEDVAAVIKQYEDIICPKNKIIISIAYHQGIVFIQFKDKEKFVKLVNELKVHKSTMIFKINIFKLIDKHRKLVMKVMNDIRFFKKLFQGY